MIKSGAQALKESSRHGRPSPATSAPVLSSRRRSCYGGQTSRAITMGGGIYGYAFQDQAGRATTPASHATAAGSGAEEDTAERDGEPHGSTEGLAGRHVPRRGGDPPRDPGAGQELIGSTSANRSDLRSIPRRITGKTPRDATSPQAIPMVRSTPRLKIPRWLAIIRLPKPTMVWIPLSATAMTVLRATSGPPWERPSRYRSIMLSPNSAEVPMMSGRP